MACRKDDLTDRLVLSWILYMAKMEVASEPLDDLSRMTQPKLPQPEPMFGR